MVWPTSAFDPLQSGTSLPSALPNPQEGLFVRDHFYQIAVSTIFQTRGRRGLYLKRGLICNSSKIAFRAFQSVVPLLLGTRKTFWPQNQFFFSTFYIDHSIWSIFQKKILKQFRFFFDFPLFHRLYQIPRRVFSFETTFTR